MIALKTIVTLFFVLYQLLRVPAVQVPEVQAPEAAALIKRPSLSIVVDKDGSLGHRDKKITPQQLNDLCKNHKTKHPNGTLNIQAHKQTRLEHVQVVLNAAAKADLTVVLFDSK